MNTVNQQCNDPVHILIAEDSPTQAELLRHALECHGYKVTSATNGRSAVELARMCKPTLIISDVLMPEMDGYQLCQKIKTDPDLKELPVILVTTLADPQDVIRGLECHADNFIIKPYDEHYLVSRVQFVLLNREIRQYDQTSMGVEIHFNGQRHFITADRLQILNLLLSTYEMAVQRNQELTRAKDELHAASNSKSEFLANMSHEIRTPMTAILGYADMLQDPACSASDRVEHVHVIRRQAEHLLAILNDILDLSKIEAGKLTVEQIEVDPRQIVSDVLSLMRVQAAEKKLSLEVTYASPIPQTIRTDPTRLRQLLINLVGNAIKFTESGSVKMILKLAKGSSAGQSRLEMDIVDSGIGLTPEQIQRLFKPFTQADNSTTRRFGGTGLGLTICRHLAQMLGGDIAVRSQVGVGSQFTVTIDPGDLSDIRMLEEDQEVMKPSELISKLKPLPVLRGRILLAEDGVHNQRAITYYLEKAGANVAIAENGKVACHMAIGAVAEGRPFDVILMDMQMPEMDGYEATASLRQREYKGPIIALTAHAMSHDRDRCIKAGCTDYLSKPIDRNALIETVAACLKKMPAAVTTELHPRNTSRKDNVVRSTLTDKGEVMELLPRFIADMPATVSRLLGLLEQQKLPELYEAAHQLKGTGGIYGFMPVTTAAERLCHAIAQGKSPVARLRHLVALIRRIEGYDSTKEALSSGKGFNPHSNHKERVA
jgi:signal transduction histidine kinase/HPt (histidine-containing phosphotransfer) domain-containing protein